jgi:hypothetical protein
LLYIEPVKAHIENKINDKKTKNVRGERMEAATVTK